jgi:hypothetical protein
VIACYDEFSCLNFYFDSFLKINNATFVMYFLVLIGNDLLLMIPSTLSDNLLLIMCTWLCFLISAGMTILGFHIVTEPVELILYLVLYIITGFQDSLLTCLVLISFFQILIVFVISNSSKIDRVEQQENIFSTSYSRIIYCRYLFCVWVKLIIYHMILT